MYRQGLFDHHVPALGATAVADSAGIAKATWGPVSEGYCWYIERYSAHCPTTAAIVSVFVVQGTTGTAAVDTSYRVDYWNPGTVGYSDVVGDSNSPIYVPAGYTFVMQWTSATSADVCVGSIQYSVHQLDPGLLTSPADLRQLQASHEHPTAPVTEVATAGKRAV